MQERPTTCKSGAPTQDGSKSSFIDKSTSVTSKKQTNVSMSIKAKMLKVKKLSLMDNIMVPIKDGRFFILTRRQRLRQRD